jgi:hypothetical protein
MDRRTESANVREQASVLADQVEHLIGLICDQDSAGRDSAAAQERRAVLESLMWLLQARHTRLKAILHRWIIFPAAGPRARRSR